MTSPRASRAIVARVRRELEAGRDRDEIFTELLAEGGAGFANAVWSASIPSDR